MSVAFNNSVTIILILLIAFSFRRLKLISIDFVKQLSYIVMCVVFPCNILANASGTKLSFDFIWIGIIAIVINIILLTIAYYSQKENILKIFTMVNITGFNIGTFAIPFTQNIVSSEAIMSLCMYDLTNSIFVFGGSYAIANMIVKSKDNNSGSLKKVFLDLFKTIPIHAYIIAIILSAFSITLPNTVSYVISSIAQSNTLLAMFMIGSAININISWTQFKKLLSLLIMRYSTTTIITLLIWFILPFDAEIRFILMVAVFAPVAAFSTIITMKMNSTSLFENSAALNSLSIMTSIAIISTLTSFYSFFIS